MGNDNRIYDNDNGQVERDLINGQWNLERKNDKEDWGLYKIDGNQITFERYYFYECPGQYIQKTGIILNDTTIQMNDKYDNRVYHFHFFANKPDSTNGFVH